MANILGSIIGGLAGMLFPGAAAATGIGSLLGGAMLPAIGAGIGTLVTGGDGKDAIRNALLMGGATALFPGAGEALRTSGFGQNVSGGIANLLGIPGQGAQALPPTMQAPPPRPVNAQPHGLPGAPPPPRPENLEQPQPVVPSQGVPTSLPSIFEMSQGQGYTPSMNPQMAAADFNSAIDMSGLHIIPIDKMLEEAAAQRSHQSTMGFIRGYAQGGEIDGPGTGTSDSVPAMIYQGGKPVSRAKLSDGEFVMTAAAVKGAGNGSRERGIRRMYELMRRFENGEMA